QHDRKLAQFKAITRALSENPRPIYVDEVDYLFRCRELLDTLRDIYDLTRVPIVFAGEKASVDLIRNSFDLGRFKRRFLQWVEFRGLSLEDARKIASELMEGVEADDDLVEVVHREAGGNIDRMVKGFAAVERFGQTNDLRRVDAALWAEFCGTTRARTNGHAAKMRRTG